VAIKPLIARDLPSPKAEPPDELAILSSVEMIVADS
jgi:hypothetical protein